MVVEFRVPGGFDCGVRFPVLSLLLFAACATTPQPWTGELIAELAAAQAEGSDTAVCFLLPGRDASDRMAVRSLGDPAVLAALREGAFRSVRVDGFAQARLFDECIGGQEGMGIVVLDPRGRPSAARPGPQDGPELAAFLRHASGRRETLRAVRAEVEGAATADAEFRLGALLLELGCRKQAVLHLVTAATGGRMAAHELLALLHGQDGRLEEARRWLRIATPSATVSVVDGYLAFKERRHQDTVRVLEAALQQQLPPRERQRASLFLGKALHECGRSDDALAVLRTLAAEATGSTFEGAALHAIAHIQDPTHGHSH